MFQSYSKLLCLGLFLVAACGGGDNPDLRRADESGVPHVGGFPFEVTASTEALSVDDGTLSGSGSIRFVETLGSVATNYHYRLTFSLDDNGEVTFVSHANAALKRGLELLFRREGSELKVFASAGSIKDDWSSFFASLNAMGTLHIAFDVHNDETVTHIIVWDEAQQIQLLDSAVDVAGGPGRGYGIYWGMHLKDAFLLSVERGEPRAGH